MNRSALEKHVQNQQNLACKLSGDLEALESLNLEGVAESAQTVLIGVARDMAEELNANLDSASLPS